jgi:hypothetical protein
LSNNTAVPPFLWTRYSRARNLRTLPVERRQVRIGDHLKIAKALRITIPESILPRADRVIE